MTTHAPLRSQWTKARSVCHVRGLDDGDSPTSLTKDTRLLAVRCSAEFGAVAWPREPLSPACPDQHFDVHHQTPVGLESR